MDADGVSFGDFGAGSGGGGGSRGKRGSGGGGGGGGGKPVVDQDLMDTWYPDCRECACCKVGKEEDMGGKISVARWGIVYWFRE